MARHTAKSHKIRKVEILVIQIEICSFAYMMRNYQKYAQEKYNYIVVDDERVIIRTKLEKPSKIKGLALI